MLDHTQPAAGYFQSMSRQFDGIVLIICSILSLLLAILLAFDLLPWISDQTRKRAILFLFMPLILFGVHVNLRLLPFSKMKFSFLSRGLFIIFVFIFLNF